MGAAAPAVCGPVFGKAIHERFFDYHEDVRPQRAADLLGGRRMMYRNRNNEWVALIAIEKIENASAQTPVQRSTQSP